MSAAVFGALLAEARSIRVSEWVFLQDRSTLVCAASCLSFEGRRLTAALDGAVGDAGARGPELRWLERSAVRTPFGFVLLEGTCEVVA